MPHACLLSWNDFKAYLAVIVSLPDVFCTTETIFHIVVQCSIITLRKFILAVAKGVLLYIGSLTKR